MASDKRISVLKARSQNADSHLARTCRRQRSVDHFQLLGTAEAPELNNAVARLVHVAIL